MDANTFKDMAIQIGKNDQPGDQGHYIDNNIIESAKANSDVSKKIVSMVADINESLNIPTAANQKLVDKAIKTFDDARDLLKEANTWCKDKNIIKASPKLAGAMQIISDSIRGSR